MASKKVAAGQCACGGGCENHPEPDPVGRYRCADCLCFTASPDRRHGWCRMGSVKKWADEISIPRNSPNYHEDEGATYEY